MSMGPHLVDGEGIPLEILAVFAGDDVVRIGHVSGVVELAFVLSRQEVVRGARALQLTAVCTLGLEERVVECRNHVTH